MKAGLPRPVNDMWIAACCLTYDLPLATLNLKDYAYFKDHHDLRILGEELMASHGSAVRATPHGQPVGFPALTTCQPVNSLTVASAPAVPTAWCQRAPTP
jgi:hypothetical protein